MYPASLVFLSLWVLPAFCTAGCATGKDDGAGRDVPDVLDLPPEADLVTDPDVDGLDPVPEPADPLPEMDIETDAGDDGPHDMTADDTVPDAEEEDISPEVDDTADIPEEVDDGADTAVDTGPCDPAVWHTYTASDTPIFVPDSDSTGITSWIDVTDCDFEVWDIRVTVNIQHTHIGELRVKLLSPDGRMVILHNFTGGSANDIVTTYPIPTDPYQTLCMATRQSSLGRWGLKVSDHAWLDEGQLVSWTIDLTGTTGGCRTDVWYPGGEFPVDIPDGNLSGISSTVEVTQSGSISSLRVGVDIEHHFIGDLIVSITSPGAVTRLLHNRTGGGSWDIRTFYPTPTASFEDLDVYIGTEKMGTWTLLVSDNAVLDSGDFFGWVLEIN